jgi:hypothetical protein
MDEKLLKPTINTDDQTKTLGWVHIMQFGTLCFIDSTIILYRGGQFYWWRKPEYPEKTTDLSQVTNKTLSHNVVSSRPRHEWGSNS